MGKWHRTNNNRSLCYSIIRGRRACAGYLVYEMPPGKNLIQIVTYHPLVSRQASDSRLPPQRPPPERFLLRRLYFLKLDRSKYFCLGFYPDRGIGHSSIWAARGKRHWSYLRLSPPHWHFTYPNCAIICPGASCTGATRYRSGCRLSRKTRPGSPSSGRPLPLVYLSSSTCC